MLSSLDHEEDDKGTVWNKEARERDKDRMSPRHAWRAIQAGHARMMSLFQVILEIIVQLEMLILLLKKEENI